MTDDQDQSPDAAEEPKDEGESDAEKEPENDTESEAETKFEFDIDKADALLADAVENGAAADAGAAPWSAPGALSESRLPRRVSETMTPPPRPTRTCQPSRPYSISVRLFSSNSRVKFLTSSSSMSFFGFLAMGCSVFVQAFLTVPSRCARASKAIS